MGYSLRIIIIVTITLLAPWLYSQDQQRVHSLMKSYENSVNSTDKADILIELSDEFTKNLPDSALKFAMESNSLSKEINYTKGIIKSDNNIALIYLDKADLKKAVKYAENAKAIAEKEGIKDELITSLLILGRIYNSLGIYDKSSEYLFESLRISEELNDKRLISPALNTLGFAYYDQADYDKALEYFLRALAICKEGNNQRCIAATLNNVGAVYRLQNKLELLKESIQAALKINLKNGNKQWIGINYKNMGYYFQGKSNIDSAMFYFQKALSIFKELKNIKLIVDTKIDIANIYFNEKIFDLSLDYSKEALDESQKYGLLRNAFGASELLSKIYTEKNEFKSANEYLRLQYRIRDSLDLESKHTNLVKMEMKYQLDKAEQIRKSEIQKKNHRFILFTTILVFIFILTIVIISTRNRIKSKNAQLQQEKLKNDLELKNKELTSNVMLIMKKNEILEEVSKKLNEIERGAYKEETKTAVKRIAKELLDNTDENIWDEFKVRFEEVHKDFYSRLIQKFPDLWPSEQRLCAFLRLNMTTKEISELTGQSIASLEKARHRLRKKLGLLNTKTNLITFLSRF